MDSPRPTPAAMEPRTKRIIESAIELAEQGGFEAVQMRELAAHAGVALGTFYKRFRSKEELLAAALELEVEKLEVRLARRPALGATPLERAEAFFQMFTRGLTRRPNLARAMIRAVSSGEPEVARKMARFHERIIALTTTALLGGAEGGPGAAGEAEPSLVASVLQKVWFASVVGWNTGLHDEHEVVRQVTLAAGLLLGAPRGSEAPQPALSR